MTDYEGMRNGMSEHFVSLLSNFDFSTVLSLIYLLAGTILFIITLYNLFIKEVPREQSNDHFLKYITLLLLSFFLLGGGFFTTGEA